MARSDDSVRVGHAGAGPHALLLHAPMCASGPETVLSGVWARRWDTADVLAAKHGSVSAASAEEVIDGSEVVANLNSHLDRVGTFLDSTAECLDILDEVGSPQVKLLCDLYHSLVMGKRPETVLAGRTRWLAHVQVADIPGATNRAPAAGPTNWMSCSTSDTADVLVSSTCPPPIPPERWNKAGKHFWGTRDTHI